MQSGKINYKKCPHCKAKNEYSIGPFFVHFHGLTEWSDGKTFGAVPSFEKSKLQKCTSCAKFYWFEQLFGGLSFDEYCEAADFYTKKYTKKHPVNWLLQRFYKKRLLYIRMNVVRSFNDRKRIHPISEKRFDARPITDEDREKLQDNALKLIHLLNQLDKENYFLKAELYRNIGCFEEAKVELKMSADDEKKNLMILKIARENRHVFVIQEPTSK